jgi:hypothetical protein
MIPEIGIPVCGTGQAPAIESNTVFDCPAVRREVSRNGRENDHGEASENSEIGKIRKASQENEYG